MGAADHSVTLKILIIGDTAVGKTSLLSRFADDCISPSHIATIGVDFRTRTIRLDDGTTVRLQIWDTAGQERFQTITKAYYKGADGAMIVYDVTNSESFEQVGKWIAQLTENVDNLPKMLVANKMDLMTDRGVVASVQGERLAEQESCPFAETSARSGTGVDEAFKKIATLVVEKKGVEQLMASKRPVGIALGNDGSDSKKRPKPKCCK